MPLHFMHGDITKVYCDAIVNAANSSLLGGGGVDGAIHRAAGPMLLEACRMLNGCETGEAKITPGFNLPARYVIHTVGPIWYGGSHREAVQLASCYRNSLNLARLHNFTSIAFPLISAGAYGYPREDALKIAVDCIRDFLKTEEMDVYIVIFDKSSIALDPSLMARIRNHLLYREPKGDFLDSQFMAMPYSASESNPQANPSLDTPLAPAAPFCPAPETGSKSSSRHESSSAITPHHSPKSQPSSASASISYSETNQHIRPIGEENRSKKHESSHVTYSPIESPVCFDASPCSTSFEPDLTAYLKRMDAGFSQTLLRLIDEKGYTDTQCYKKANISRKLFSKIRSDVNYRPSKNTVLAFAVALELSLDETMDLLRRAGFTLSHSNTADMIVEYFINEKNYDILLINLVLLKYDQPLLA